MNKEWHRMGQRALTLTRILGFDGFKVTGYFETYDGTCICDEVGARWLRGMKLILAVTRRWLACCSSCGRSCRSMHERLPARR
jgi:hypothetical protein